MSALKLLLDEDVWAGLATELRNRGYDVLAVNEVGRKGFSDIEQLRFATGQRRAILTHNIRDFAPLAQQFIVQAEHHAGIIVAYKIPKGALLRRTAAFLAVESADNLQNTLRFL